MNSSTSDSLQVSGSTLTASFGFYSNGDCSGSLGASSTLSGTFVLGAVVSVALGSATVEATKRDSTLVSGVLTVYDEVEVASFNSFGICGGGWVAGVEKDITGCLTDPAGTVSKGLLFIDDAATPDRLYSEDPSSTPDASGYPTALDSTGYMERQ